MKEKNDEVNNKKISRLSKLAKDATKVGVEVGKKVKKTIDEVSSEIKEELEIEREKKKYSPQKKSVSSRKKPDHSLTSSSVRKTEGHNILSPDGLENQIYSWYGWMWSIFAYIFVIIISFMISSADNRFKILPIILLIGFPFYLFWAMINSIPEVKVGRWTVFSRKDISLKNQLSFGKAIMRTFSREMIRNSPEGAIIIGLFILVLLWVLISPFIT